MRSLVIAAVLFASARAGAQEASAAGELPPSEAPPKPKPKNLDLSIMGGVGGGFTLTAGKMSIEPVGPAGSFSVEVGMRFYKHLYGTLLFDGTFFSNASSQKNTASYLIGTRGGWLTNPEGFGLFGDLGIGYRIVAVTDTNGTSQTLTGADLLVGVGLHFKVGPFRLFAPRIDFAPGAAGNQEHYLFTLGAVAMFNYDIGRRQKHED